MQTLFLGFLGRPVGPWLAHKHIVVFELQSAGLLSFQFLLSLLRLRTREIANGRVLFNRYTILPSDLHLSLLLVGVGGETRRRLQFPFLFALSLPLPMAFNCSLFFLPALQHTPHPHAASHTLARSPLAWIFLS